MIRALQFLIAVFSFITIKLTFSHLNCFKNPSRQMFVINIIRLSTSILSSYFLYQNQNQNSWLLFLIGSPTFFLNFPNVKFFRKQKIDHKVHFSIISSSFFILPLFFVFVLTIHIFKLELIFAYLTSELWFSTYPVLKFNRNRNMLIQIKEFLSLSAVYYAFQGNEKLANNQLLSSIIIAFFNFTFCSIPKFWYANIISLLNMLCGIIAIYKQIFEFSTKPQFRVLFYVLAGQFFDVFDGRAADRFGSTKYGEMFDDAADFTSFGVATGVLIYQSFHHTFYFSHSVSLISAMFYISCVAFRLVRFVINKHKSGKTGGVRFFEGLPSPATSAFVITLTVGIQSFKMQNLSVFEHYKKIIQVIYLGLIICILTLTVSKIKYAHFGRVFASKDFVSHKAMGMCGFALISAVSQCIVTKNPDGIVGFGIVGIVWYIFSPILTQKLYLRAETADMESSETDDKDE